MYNFKYFNKSWKNNYLNIITFYYYAFDKIKILNISYINYN